MGRRFGSFSLGLLVLAMPLAGLAPVAAETPAAQGDPSEQGSFEAATITDGRDMPVVFIHGIDPPSPTGRSYASSDQDFANPRSLFAKWGWKSASDLYAVRYYECAAMSGPHVIDISGEAYGARHADHNPTVLGAGDGHTDNDLPNDGLNCHPHSHDTWTGIEHIAYHFAKALDAKFGEGAPGGARCIKIVAHSMGGLVTRYALGMIEENQATPNSPPNPDFPSRLCVASVVTWGTPFGGSAWADKCQWALQCVQMSTDSGFLKEWARRFPHPDVGGTTRWHVVGTEPSDGVVTAGSATRFPAEEKVVYKSHSVAHFSGGQWSTAWGRGAYYDVHGGIAQTARARFERADGTVDLDATYWPIRAAYMSLAYSTPDESWACGSQKAPWPVRLRTTYVAEDSFGGCRMSVDVPAGVNRLFVSAEGAEGSRQVYLKGPDAQGCNVGGSPGCDVDFPAAGRWTLSVWNDGGSQAPIRHSISTDTQYDCEYAGDAGDSFALARRATIPILRCAAALRPGLGDASDWYSFSGESGQRVQVELEPNSAARYAVCLHRPTGASATCAAPAGAGAPRSLDHTLTEKGEWRLAVTSEAGEGSYWLNLRALWGGQNDCATGSDAPNTHASAVPRVMPISSCSASLPAGDFDDYYKVGLTAGQVLEVQAIPNGAADFAVCVFRPDDASFNTARCSAAPGKGVVEDVRVDVSQTGDWRILVWTVTGSGSYTLTARAGAAPAPTNDCGTSTDAGSTFAGATAIRLPANCPAALSSTSDVDWFSFPVSSGDVISLHVDPFYGVRTTSCLFKPNGAASSCIGPDGPESVRLVADASGSWRVRVTTDYYPGGYQLVVSAADQAPQNDCGLGRDAGTSHATALAITLFARCEGQFPALSTDSDDWFAFPATKGHKILVELGHGDPELSVRGCLYAPGALTPTVCRGDGTSFETVAPTTGNWVLAVDEPKMRSDAPYYFRVHVDNDCDLGGDAPTVKRLVLPADCTGYKSHPGDAFDLYGVQMTRGQRLTASVSYKSPIEVIVCIGSPGGRGGEPRTFCSPYGERRLEAAVSAPIDEDGEWNVHLLVACRPIPCTPENEARNVGEYRLRLHRTTIDDDCDLGRDAADDLDLFADRVAFPVAGCAGSFPAGESDSTDRYRFNVKTGQTVKATRVAAEGMKMCVSTGDLLGRRTCAPTAAGPQSVTLTASSDAEWELEAEGASQSYTLHLRERVRENDCNSGGDAPENEPGATLNLPVFDCSGFLDDDPLHPDPLDGYRFNVAAGRSYRITLASESAHAITFVVPGVRAASHAPDSLDPESVMCCSWGASKGRPEVFSFVAGPSATWGMWIDGVPGTSYYLTVRAVADEDGDGCHGGTVHIGDSRHDPIILPPGKTCRARIGEDDVDWWSVPSRVAEHVTITYSSLTQQSDRFCLYDPAGERVGCRPESLVDTRNTLEAEGRVDGSFLIRVDSLLDPHHVYAIVANVMPSDCSSGRDAGATAATAVTLALPLAGCHGRIEGEDGGDWYRFEAPTGNLLRLDLSANATLDYCLYKPSSMSTPRSCGGVDPAAPENLTIRVTESGSWGLHVKPRTTSAGASGPYRLALALTPILDECGTGGEAGNSFASASEIPLPASCSGSLGDTDAHDWYRFPAYDRQVVSASVTAPRLQDFRLCLYRPDSTAAVQCSSTGLTGGTARIGFTADAEGDWRLHVARTSGSGSYGMSLTVRQTDCGIAGDAGDTFDGASAVTPPLSACAAALPDRSSDATDYYRFPVAGGDAIHVTLATRPGRTVCLLTPRGAETACGEPDASGERRLSARASEAGEWRVQVRADPSKGSYRLSLNVTTLAPSTPTVACTPSTVEPNQTVTCRFRSSDPESLPLAYSVDWGDGSGPERVPASGSAPSGVEQSVARAFARTGTYAVRVTATNTATPALTSPAGTATIKVSGCVATPTNNHFACAIAVGSLPYTRDQSTADATLEPGETRCYPMTGTVWFKYVAGFSGDVAVETRGSNFDTGLGVYTGTRVDALTSVGCNDQGWNRSDPTSRVTFPASEGTTYWIQAGGTAGATGNLHLRVYMPSLLDE